MTKAEWLGCADPTPMLEFLSHKGSARKLRLLTAAVARGMDMLDLAATCEQVAEGRITPRSLRLRCSTVLSPRTPRPVGQPTPQLVGPPMPNHRQTMVIAALRELPEAAAKDAVRLASSTIPKEIADAIRDLFGNPFRTLPSRPEAIAPLAEQIYAGQWELMPLLGEWLQEHGYWSEGEHCLDPNSQHVKGCWVVDWVTGRE